MPSVKDALNEYFRLKANFENEINANKRKISNNSALSKREKRAEYLKLMPKCVNCNERSKKGTIFSITFTPHNEKVDAYRRFKVICGNLANPCNLHIEINVGSVDNLNNLIEEVRSEINATKNSIIDDKNKLLFGLITTETAIENFDKNKTYLDELTGIYESFLEQLNKIIDNPSKKQELDESLVLLYDNIDKIKDSIKKMNETNESQYAVNAANIYHTTIEPLLAKIRRLKYGENMVFNDDSTNTCRLMQHPVSLQESLSISTYTDKIVAYDVGLKVKKIPKKKGLIIEESSSLDTSGGASEKEFTIKIKEAGEPTPNNEIEEDEPIIGQGKDGIAWNNPNYQELWNKLPEQLKTEFKTNIDWMNEFMHKCVNERKKHGPGWDDCRLTEPPNLVIPPREMENGQYDFGVSIYNKSFNKMAQSLKNTYLTFYKEDPQTKQKNYNMLIDALNRLVEKEVNFGRGFF